MKLTHTSIFIFLFGFAIAFFVSCSDQEKVEPRIALQNNSITVDPNPFPFYKNIEIKVGLNFEVLSWGKGVDSLGGYLLLMSDSIKNSYKSISVERKGVIVDAWNMDLDNDGNPELYIQFVVRENINDVNVYEFVNNSFDKISFPSLNSYKGYEGNDKFFVKNGELFRNVPIVAIDSGKTTTIVKTLKYNLKGNTFSSTEVKD